MTARFFKLTELHQKIDSALHRERDKRAPDHPAVVALRQRKSRVRDLLNRLTRQPIPC